ncbi:hypothetical protein Tco_1554048 [Tanacetum coccineum]
MNSVRDLAKMKDESDQIITSKDDVRLVYKSEGGFERDGEGRGSSGNMRQWWLLDRLWVVGGGVAVIRRLGRLCVDGGGGGIIKVVDVQCEVVFLMGGAIGAGAVCMGVRGVALGVGGGASGEDDVGWQGVVMGGWWGRVGCGVVWKGVQLLGGVLLVRWGVSRRAAERSLGPNGVPSDYACTAQGSWGSGRRGQGGTVVEGLGGVGALMCGEAINEKRKRRPGERDGTGTEGGGESGGGGRGRGRTGYGRRRGGGEQWRGSGWAKVAVGAAGGSQGTRVASGGEWNGTEEGPGSVAAELMRCSRVCKCPGGAGGTGCTRRPVGGGRCGGGGCWEVCWIGARLGWGGGIRGSSALSDRCGGVRGGGVRGDAVWWRASEVFVVVGGGGVGVGCGWNVGDEVRGTGRREEACPQRGEGGGFGARGGRRTEQGGKERALENRGLEVNRVYRLF